MPDSIQATGSAADAPRDIDTIVTELTSLQGQLLDLSRSMADATALIQLHTEYLAVQTVLNQAAHAQLAADDAVFAQATSTLKDQAKLLDGMENQIKGIVKDVALAGKIVGAVTQVIALIAKV